MIATGFVTSTRARAVQADHYADEIIEIVDTEKDPARARVRTDARKWVTSKLAPRKYGDKLETENRNTVDVSDPLTALLERIAASGTKVCDPRPK
jgi:hypothetical protein